MTRAGHSAFSKTKRPTLAPAVRYDAGSLIAGLARRRANIKVFHEAIKTERETIKYQRYIISQIDPEHPDVSVLKKNITKRLINVKTFQKAIQDERKLIKQERAMASNLRQNR